MVNIFTFPLRYLALKDDQKRHLFWRDLLGVMVLATFLSAPFWLTDANYFGNGGFLDKFGGFAGVLTGFYVAGLLGIASFLGASPSLDEEIQVGKIYGPPKNGAPNPLSRREYVCSMFGYLSFLSLAISVAALLLVVITDPLAQYMAGHKKHWAYLLTSGFLVFLVNFVLAHMVATTCHGLYYLIDRLYATSPELMTKEASAAAGLGGEQRPLK